MTGAASATFARVPVSGDDDAFATALVALCRAHGVLAPVERLTDGLVAGGAGLEPEQAELALRRVGMSCRVARRNVASLARTELPVLAFLRQGRFAIIERLEGDNFVISQPESGGGRVVWTIDELRGHYAGRMLSSRPLDVLTNRLGERAAERGHWILSRVLANAPLYRDVMIAAFAANILAVGASLFSMQVYDRVVPSGAMDTLWILASGVGLAICLEWALRIMRARLIDVTGRDLDLDLSTRLFEHVSEISLAHQPKSTGVFANQVRDFAVVREFFTSGAVAALSDLPFTLIYIVILAYIGGPLALVTLAGAVAIVAPGALFQRRLARSSRTHHKESAALNGILLETVAHLETVKAARAERRLQRAYAHLSEAIVASSLSNRDLSNKITQLVASAQQLAYAGVVIAGVYRIGAGQMTVGALIACTLLSGRALTPMSRVAGLLARWQGVRAAMEGLDAIMATPVERDGDRRYLRAPDFKGAYAFRKVAFAHDADAPPTLRIDALDLRAGEHAALLGPNGAGKSTLLRLLAGYVAPTSGSLLLDNLALSQIDPIDRRRQIGYLPQAAALFQGTLRENLLLDHGVHSDDELMGALDAVGLGAFVRRDPRGLDLMIHGNGNVSGGQRQAIGLARVFLQDPRIVLLDEPTAAFDQITERHVIAHLRGWLGSRTAVIATHKREVLALTDMAIVIRDGALAYHGALDRILEGGAAADAPRAAE